MNSSSLSYPIQRPSLRLNFAWTLIGNLVYAGSQWLLLVLLAKFTSAADVGLFALGLAITAPVFMLTNLQLRAIQATDTQNSYQFGDYMTGRLLMTAVALLVVVVILGVGNYESQVAWVIFLIGLTKATESFSDIIYGLWQKEERMNLIALSMIAKAGTSLLAMGGLLWLTGNLLWGIVGLLGAWSAVAMLFDVVVLWQGGGRLHLRWQWKTLWALGQLAFPMGVVMMLISLNSNIPRYFLENLAGAEELGYFAAVGSLVMVGNTVVGALGQAVVTRLAHYYNLGRGQDFRQLLAKLLAVAILLGIAGLVVAWVIGAWVLGWLFAPDYALFGNVLIGMMGVALLLYIASFLGYALTAVRYFKAQMGLFGLVTAVLLLSSWLFIPPYHSWGAVGSLGLATLIQLVASGGLLHHALKHLPTPKEVA